MVTRRRRAGIDDSKKQPRVTAYSLGSSDNFDFFPNLDTSGMLGGSPEMSAVDALKTGTYKPFMRFMEYEGKWEGKPHRSEFSASIKDDMDGAIVPLHGGGSFAWKPESAAVTGPGPAGVMPPGGQDAGGITAEMQRIEELERMYGAPENRAPVRRKYYANPRQYYDHVLFADSYANTFAGEVIDTLVDFIMGNGVHPSLALRNPSGDAEADMAELEKGKEAIDDLNAIDDWYSDTSAERQDSWFDVPFQDKIKSAITNMLVFGRCCIVKEYWEHLPKVEDDVEAKTPGSTSKDDDPSGADEDKKKEMNAAVDSDPLPNVLKVVHPIEMGLTEVELYSGKVAGIWISNDQPYMPMKDMIYLVNGYSSPMIGSATYGFSRLQRSIDQTRMYRRLLALNLPQFLKTSASGMGAFIMNTTGYPQAVRESIRQNLTSMYRTGEIAVIDYANTKDFEWKEFKINTDIKALVELERSLLSTISTVLGVPHSIVFDSAESRATLIGRIVTFTNTTVQALRSSIGRQLVQQHWLPNLRKRQDKSYLEKYVVEAEFSDHTLETKLEKVERLLQETQLNPYRDAYLGEELGIRNYLSKVDTEKREEQDQMEKDAMEAKMMGPASAMSSAGAGGKEGSKGPASRSRSKNGKPMATKRETMQRRSQGSNSG